LLSSDQMDDVKTVGCGYSRDVSHMITVIQMALLALTILLIVECSALLAISKRQEAMSETLLRQSGDMQAMLAQRLHETRYQEGSSRNGNGN
jgi:hypothetical protein